MATTYLLRVRNNTPNDALVVITSFAKEARFVLNAGFDTTLNAQEGRKVLTFFSDTGNFLSSRPLDIGSNTLVLVDPTAYSAAAPAPASVLPGPLPPFDPSAV
jgi:hypothetical protein